MVEQADLNLVSRIDRDIIRAIKNDELKLTGGDIRYLVDVYYQIQEFRKAASNQQRGNEEAGEPWRFPDWVAVQFYLVEKQIRRVIDAWTDVNPVAVWAKSQIGIGPIIAAGLSAHIDMDIATTAGKIWRFAGQDPTCKWEKGKKRPWNARLKVLCWKIGDSFVKTSGNEKSYYGKLYRQRKALEIERNEAGLFAAQAKAALEEKNYSKDTVARKCYEAGILPPGRIDLRARRWAVKLFLAHWHEVAYKEHYKKEPPVPYPIAHMGHVDWIRPPKGEKK